MYTRCTDVGRTHHAQAPTNHAVAVTAAQRRLHPRNALVLRTRHRIVREVHIPPTKARRRGLTGTRCMRRTSKRISCERNSNVVRDARETTHRNGRSIGCTHIPLDRGAVDPHKRQTNRRLPLLRRLEDEVVEGITDLRVGARVCVRKLDCTRRVRTTVNGEPIRPSPNTHIHAHPQGVSHVAAWCSE